MKKFLFLSFWILFTVSCEPLEKEPLPGFGAIQGFTFIGSTNESLQGFKVSLPNYVDQTTDANGYFKFEGVIEGNHTVSVYKGSTFLSSKQTSVVEGNISTLMFPFEYAALPKEALPDFSVVDIHAESKWDYWVVGKEEYFYIDAENSLPKSVFYHSFKDNKDYGIFFDSKGMPSRVITDHFIFLFENFTGGKVDLGILTPSGEFKIARGIPTDLTSSPKSAKSGQSAQSARAELLRWTGRVIGAIPCIASGAAALISGGVAIPLALWTCGNYLAGMAKNFFDDAHVENGFTRFVDKYYIGGTVYKCLDPNLSSCLLSLAQAGLDSYADYVEEMDGKEKSLEKLDGLLTGVISLRELILQPGIEGKDAWVGMDGWPDCSETYSRSGNDSLLLIIKEVNSVNSCFKSENISFLQFPLQNIPLNSIILSAKLEVYGYAVINSASLPVISLNKINSFWIEDGISWNNKPRGELIGNLEFINQGVPSWYSWTVTSFIQDYVYTGDNFGFSLSAAKINTYSEVCSSDHPYLAHKPRIIITYL
jgi:hypothetical protein